MRPFFFQIEVEPLPDNPQTEHLKKALAHVWVFDDSIEIAKDRAFKYIWEYGWYPVKVESASEMLPEQTAHLDRLEEANHHQAILNGISFDLHAFPKNPRPGVFSVETLQKPPKKHHLC